MAGQHMENLFKRFKSDVVSIKTKSGAILEGRITEVTNDYVCLSEANGPEGTQLFLFFDSMESVTKAPAPAV